MIRTYLELIGKIESEIEVMNNEIMCRMQRSKEDLEIDMSMTGMGFASASTILAEIGNYKDFGTADVCLFKLLMQYPDQEIQD